GVEAHRPRVGTIDPQQDLVAAGGGEVVEPGVQEHGAQAQPLRVGVDGEVVDLADGRGPALEPVQAEDAPVRVDGHEEVVGPEPVRLATLPEACQVPAAVGPGAVGGGEHGDDAVLVVVRTAGPDHDPGRRGRTGRRGGDL